ncbi:MAG: 50S ribosomal protein L15 [Fibrobacterota bacterium]
MMLNELTPAEGSVKKAKRVGRGNGSGLGKTAGRGHNGARSRSGYTHKPYFEGGQLPIIKRLPKRGFTNPFKKEFQIVNLPDLENAAAKDPSMVDFDPSGMAAAGLIKHENKPVKILGRGDIASAVTVKADAFSKSAEEKITKAGGKVEVLNRA